MKQLIVAPIVLVKLNVTITINESIICHTQQLIVSTAKQLIRSYSANFFAVQMQYICFNVMCIHIMACITDRDLTYH